MPLFHAASMELLNIVQAVFSTIHVLAILQICFPSRTQTTSKDSTHVVQSEKSNSFKAIQSQQYTHSTLLTKESRPKYYVVGMFSHELHMHWMLCLWNLIVLYVHDSPHTRVHLIMAEVAVRAYQWNENENLQKLADSSSQISRPLSFVNILLFRFSSEASISPETVAPKDTELVPVPVPLPSEYNDAEKSTDTLDSSRNNDSPSKQTTRKVLKREASDDSLVIPKTVDTSWRRYISMLPHISTSYSKKGWGSLRSKISLAETSDDDSDRPSESSLATSAASTPTTFRLKSVRSLYRAQLNSNFAYTDSTCESSNTNTNTNTNTNPGSKIVEGGMRHFPPEFRVTVSATKPLQDTPIGVSFRKMSQETSEIQISGVSETGLFGKSKLRVGHTLLSINGAKCPSTCQEVVAMVKETKGKIVLVVGRNYAVATIDKDEPSPSARHAGILFGVSPTGVFIKHIDPSGPFGGSCLRRGMRVASIGGVKCRRSLGVAYALVKREGPMVVVAHDE